MTHVELITKLMNFDNKAFNSENISSENEKIFHEGVQFAYKFLLSLLTNNEALTEMQKILDEEETLTY